MISISIQTKKNHPNSRQGHRGNEEDLHPAKDILNKNASFQETAVDNSNGSQEANSEHLMLNPGGLNTKREIGIFRKDNAVARSKTQEHYLGSYKA